MNIMNELKKFSRKDIIPVLIELMKNKINQNYRLTKLNVNENHFFCELTNNNDSCQFISDILDENFTLEMRETNGNIINTSKIYYDENNVVKANSIIAASINKNNMHYESWPFDILKNMANCLLIHENIDLEYIKILEKKYPGIIKSLFNGLQVIKKEVKNYCYFISEEIKLTENGIEFEKSLEQLDINDPENIFPDNSVIIEMGQINDGKIENIHLENEEDIRVIENVLISNFLENAEMMLELDRLEEINYPDIQEKYFNKDKNILRRVTDNENIRKRLRN